LPRELLADGKQHGQIDVLSVTIAISLQS